MKFGILTLIISLLLSSTAYAQGINKCAFMQSKYARIEEMREALNAMKELQAERSHAQEIRDLLVDTHDSREIALLAEALEEESQALQAEGSFNRNVVIGSGLGSLILAGLIIKKMRKSVEGANLAARLIAAIKSANKTVVGKILTGTFVVSIAASIWFGSRLNEISDQRKFLVSLIAKLDALKDLSDQIVALTEELEQEEIAFSLRVEDLQAEGILEYRQGVINCL